MLKLFQNKKIFITGHTGFKGSWLVYFLHSLGAEIKGYSLPAPKLSLFKMSDIADMCEHVEGDIRDKEKLKNEVHSFDPDIIFHLAAQPLVQQSYLDPTYTFEVNQLGTIYLMEAIRSMKTPCITIVVTTDKVYEDQNWHYPYRENDRLGGYDPYSASKASCEISVSSYRNSFFNPLDYQKHCKVIATARAGNVIGGGDFSINRLIPDILKAILSDKVVTVRNPAAVRPWQHVLDALYGYIILAENILKNPKDQVFQSAWNFGPKSEDIFNVEQITKMCIAAYGKGTYQIKQNPELLKETSVLNLDISKSRNILNWEPLWDTELAIQKTVQWQMAFEKGEDDLPSVMNDQIDNFLGCLK